MSSEANDNKTGLFLTAIVAVVAIFGMVMLFGGQKTGTPQIVYTGGADAEVSEDLAGEAIAGATYGFKDACWQCNLGNLMRFRTCGSYENVTGVCWTQSKWISYGKSLCSEFGLNATNFTYSGRCLVGTNNLPRFS
ncbi:hypothetical protein J4227_00075 [Candidatus Woesearchaeota archaeon]|nr:hypothetical protein [Candidatus Woesearchaeota archaeon]